MDFSKNLRAFLNGFSLKNLSGHEMFLAIATYGVKGNSSQEITVFDVRNRWPKSLLRTAYNSIFYSRAQDAGWIDSIRQGIFIVNNDGVQHIIDLIDVDNKKAQSSNGGLYIFEKKSTHSFDKFLRGRFAKSKSKVFIADSWVDETIFDNVIDSIGKTLQIHLIYGQKRGTFDSRVVRFQKEYSKFLIKKYHDLHDRFLIIDDAGYIIGPSIKDAASNSPAIVVALGKKESVRLIKFFQTLWLKAK